MRRMKTGTGRQRVKKDYPLLKTERLSPTKNSGKKLVFRSPAFDIEYSPHCLQEDIPSLSKDVLKRIKNAIENRLAVAPAIFGKPLRYTLKNLWSLRVGDHRVIYQIHGTKVLVLRIGHRKDAYERKIH